MTAKDLKEMLTTIAGEAKALRDAGVTAVAVGDIRVELAANEPPPAPLNLNDGKDEEPRDLLKDPATFGGSIPRRRGHEYQEDDDDDARR